VHIDKLYFTLPEVLERWRLSETDLVYLAENDKLRLSVRVFHAAVEFGDIEEGADGERFRVPWERKPFSGLLDLHDHPPARRPTRSCKAETIPLRIPLRS